MFGNRCSGCARKVKSNFSFCPYCGFRLKDEGEQLREFGLLGQSEPILPMGLNAIFNSLMNEMNKNMGGEKNMMPQDGGIRINISMADPNGNISGRPEGVVPKKIKITEEMEKKLATLPRKEAEASVRRMSTKLVYELEVPGVKNLQDVIFSRLENSVEMKAIGTDTIFTKQIPVQAPLLGYRLQDGKLILEFKN